MAMEQPNRTVGRGARERILDAASELFYQRGTGAVGIDTVVEHAGVAKMSLYKHFKGKDDLIVAVLQRRGEAWLGWFTAEVERLAPSVRARPLAVFDALAVWFESPDFRGCAFMNATTEICDGQHPVREVARRHKQEVLAILRGWCAAADAPDPGSAAREIAILMDGATVWALTDRSSTAAAEAKAAAAALIGAWDRSGRTAAPAPAPPAGSPAGPATL